MALSRPISELLEALKNEGKFGQDAALDSLNNWLDVYDGRAKELLEHCSVDTLIKHVLPPLRIAVPQLPKRTPVFGRGPVPF